MGPAHRLIVLTSTLARDHCTRYLQPMLETFVALSSFNCLTRPEEPEDPSP